MVQALKVVLTHPVTRKVGEAALVELSAQLTRRLSRK